MGDFLLSTAGPVSGEVRFLEGAVESKQSDDSLAYSTPVLHSPLQQLTEQFGGKRRHFALHLAPLGTTVQQSVWQALLTIPHGERRSYKDIAGLIDNPNAVRAVGLANSRNPIAIIIPCHRVLGAKSLGGFSAKGGVETKVWLLRHEGAAGLLI